MDSIKQDIIKYGLNGFKEYFVPALCGGIKVKKIIRIEDDNVLNLNGGCEYAFVLEDDTLAIFHLTNKVNDDSLRRYQLIEAYLRYMLKENVSTYIISLQDKQGVYDVGGYVYRAKVICMISMDCRTKLKYFRDKIKDNKVFTEADIVDLMSIPLMGGNMLIMERVKIAIDILEGSEVDKREEIKAVLYGFAKQFITKEECREMEMIFKYE